MVHVRADTLLMAGARVITGLEGALRDACLDDAIRTSRRLMDQTSELIARPRRRVNGMRPANDTESY